MRYDCFSISANETYEQNKLENDVKAEHPAFLEHLQLQAIAANACNSDPASLAEKERRLSEIILQLQKAREHLQSQKEYFQNTSNKVSES